jgi:transposase
VSRMKHDATALPDDPKLLKEMLFRVSHKYETEISILSQTNKQLTEENERLKEKYELLRKKLFGRASEKLTKEEEAQGLLFNEAEDGVEISSDSSEEESVIIVSPHERRKAGRKALSDSLPREEIIYDLDLEEKKCPCCGKERPHIGQDETEELDIIPAKIHVIKRVYKKYGACGCDEFLHAETPEVKSAPFEKRMIPGSIASAGLLAFVFTSKFADSLPFYRQSKMFERIDADISRATMCNWVIAAHERMTLFFEVFEEQLKSGNFIRMDETTVQVLHEQGRSPQSKSYMWVAIGYPIRGKPLVLFKYHPTRSGDVPDQFLSGFTGYLQTDGYDGYNRAVMNNNIFHVGCMAHARREFNNAYEVGKKNRDSKAFKALAYIQKIYKIESDLRSRSLSDEIFIERRGKLTLPVLEELHAWLLRNKAEVLPQSLVGKAISYTLNEWEKLIRYLDLACMTPDNNEIERIIRPFVVGRKNWLFSNTPRGAHASAAMYSLIESAKANRLEPYAYLRFLFSKLPHAQDRESVKKLLPCFLSSEDIALHTGRI